MGSSEPYVAYTEGAESDYQKLIVDANGSLLVNIASSLVPKKYDYIALTYVTGIAPGAGEIETVTYKTGGAGGTTVATLTLGYDVSDRLETITRS